jgi:DNA-binding transcriptional ArsR family regulator|tara:strand:+ start:1018 stop:1248 length:231 start_codon:yes stop_codon:yes gene_type:complete
MAKIDRVLKEIVKILREDTRGLTIQELSLLTKVSRITAAMALARLEGAKLIDVRVIGNCKLHYLRVNITQKEKILI